MKLIIVTLALVFTSLNSHSQRDSIGLFWEKIISRKVSIPVETYKDSCYYSNNLLLIDINKDAKVLSVRVSDNAEYWLKKELSRFTASMDYKPLEKIIKQSGLKKTTIAIPVIIKSMVMSCKSKSNAYYWFSSKYYSFNDELLSGDLVFLNPIEITLIGVSH